MSSKESSQSIFAEIESMMLMHTHQEFAICYQEIKLDHALLRIFHVITNDSVTAANDEHLHDANDGEV